MSRSNRDDITRFGFGGKSGGSSSIDYTLSERVIGKWINDKPIYQRTFLTNTAHTINLIDSIVDLELYDIDYVITIDGCFIQDDNIIVPINTLWMATFYDPSNKKLNNFTTSSTQVNCNCYVTIQYTKTTD